MTFRLFLVLMAVLASQGAEGQRGPLRPNDARYRLQRYGPVPFVRELPQSGVRELPQAVPSPTPSPSTLRMERSTMPMGTTMDTMGSTMNEC